MQKHWNSTRYAPARPTASSVRGTGHAVGAARMGKPEVRAALEQTDAMTTLLSKTSSPRFSSVEKCEGIVQRAEKGGVLSMAELLTVADTLRNFRELVKVTA